MAYLRNLKLIFLVPLEFLYLLIYSVVLNIWSLFRIVFPPKPKSIRGEVVLVTGGANGIGRSICHKLIKKEKNITVIIWDVNQKASLETVLELKAEGVKNVFSFEVDVSNREQVEQAARKIHDEIGDVTMLFNNAGIAGVPMASWKEEPAITEKIFGVNALSHCWTLREFLPAMIEAGKGHVIETCSILGFLPSPTGATYCASKFAIRGYIESVKEEIRLLPSKPKIEFTSVYPHLVATDLTANMQLKLDRYTFLNISMTPDFVASKIVDGVLQGKEHIYIPWWTHLFRFLLDNSPPEIIRKFTDFAGSPAKLTELV